MSSQVGVSQHRGGESDRHVWPLNPGREGKGSESWPDPCAPRPRVPADEHLPAGQHRHAELRPPAALRENLPGAPRAAGLPRPPQRPPAGAAHLDFQPQRHPDGPRREGAPLHGLRPALPACVSAPSVPHAEIPLSLRQDRVPPRGLPTQGSPGAQPLCVTSGPGGTPAPASSRFRGPYAVLCRLWPFCH